MEHYVYILWSETLKRYYCGETKDVENRLLVHNKGGNKYTTKGIPWTLVKVFKVSNRSEGRELEKRIKKRGIRRFLEE